VRARWTEGAASRTESRSSVVYDTSTFVTDTIHEVIKTLLEAFVLVVVVVYLFLGSLRATISHHRACRSA
jgi:multidrug efflux pump subunit AcrB